LGRKYRNRPVFCTKTVGTCHFSDSTGSPTNRSVFTSGSPVCLVCANTWVVCQHVGITWGSMKLAASGRAYVPDPSYGLLYALVRPFFSSLVD
jgi:hypothetical protein